MKTTKLQIIWFPMKYKTMKKKFIFACRYGDLDFKGCKPWFHENTTCICRKSKTEDLKHIIEYSELIGKSEIITFIEDRKGSLDGLIYSKSCFISWWGEGKSLKLVFSDFRRHKSFSTSASGFFLEVQSSSPIPPPTT